MPKFPLFLLKIKEAVQNARGTFWTEALSRNANGLVRSTNGLKASAFSPRCNLLVDLLHLPV